MTTVKGRCQPVSRTKPPLRRKLRSSNTNTKDILQTQSVCKLKYVLTKKLQIQKPTKHRKCEYLKNITNTKGLQIQICAYKKHRKYKIPQMWILKKHCKHKRLALQASRQTGWWREENWVLPILILASATLLLLLLFQVDHIAALARQQSNLLLPTKTLMAFCRFCSWSNRSEEAGAVGGIWPDHTAPQPPQPISSLPSSTTSLYLPPPPKNSQNPPGVLV